MYIFTTLEFPTHNNDFHTPRCILCAKDYGKMYTENSEKITMMNIIKANKKPQAYLSICWTACGASDIQDLRGEQEKEG